MRNKDEKDRHNLDQNVNDWLEACVNAADATLDVLYPDFQSELKVLRHYEKGTDARQVTNDYASFVNKTSDVDDIELGNLLYQQLASAEQDTSCQEGSEELKVHTSLTINVARLASRLKSIVEKLKSIGDSIDSFCDRIESLDIKMDTLTNKVEHINRQISQYHKHIHTTSQQLAKCSVQPEANERKVSALAQCSQNHVHSELCPIEKISVSNMSHVKLLLHLNYVFAVEVDKNNFPNELQLWWYDSEHNFCRSRFTGSSKRNLLCHSIDNATEVLWSKRDSLYTRSEPLLAGERCC